MQTLTVNLGARSYPILVGKGLLARTDCYAPHLRGGKLLIVTNETIAPLYLDLVRQALIELRPDALVLPDGENFKNLDTAARIYDALLDGHYGRDCTLIALGGGVIGDMAGFAAATYQRGVDFIQVPTTLLSQVDSSVGGKTGVNHPLGKNMIGAFHQPRVVITDIDSLRSLPERELRAGLAEVIKYGLLGDVEFFAWQEQNMARLLARDSEALTHAILRSCHDKAQIVAADEHESGQRALLNLGHSFAHAIETALGYGTWLHGEAVGAGMCMAADLSCRLGWLPAADRDRAIKLIAQAGLPTQLPPELNAEDFRRLMAHDKKVLAGNLRLVLLKDLGQAVVTADFNPAQLGATLDAYTRA